MKLNKILIALAATAIVGCTSDDLSDFTANQAVEDSNLVELDPNFVLAGVGAESNLTRTHWDQDAVTKGLVNKFLPIYNSDAAANALLSVGADLKAQAIGLCWLGQTVGTDVYTNYQFYHFGWLNNDETEADIQCDKLENGAFYSDLKLTAAGTEGDEADESNFAYVSGTGTPKDDLNFNSGVYKTDNKAIFGGQYIVYYPFNAAFKEAGTIPARAETKFDWDINTDKYTSAKLGEATFRYSAPVTIEGGDQAADFGLYNLSSLVRLRVSTVAGDGAIGKEIDQIVLYSASESLLQQANLAADKIAAGKTGTELYADKEGTKTITTNFKMDGKEKPTLNEVEKTTVSAYITVLPTTVDDLVALVHNKTDKTWARIEMPTKEFEAGKAQVLDISVKAADFKAEYIAVDDASLRNALDEANTYAVDADHAATITVIGDITLKSDLNIGASGTPSLTNSNNITITGDDIIVPQDVVLTLRTNMESDVRVLGKSCCTGAKGGWLIVSQGTINNVTMEPTEVKKVLTPTEYDNYNPKLSFNLHGATVAAGSTIDVQAGNVDVQRPVEHKGNIQIAEGAKVIVKSTGDLNFMGSNVENNGTIEVEKAGKFDMTDSKGNATASDGQRMTNNGTFIHNVDAGVGTAVQSMNQNGEYRCRVDDQPKLDDAFLQWTACSVIEMVNTGVKNYDLGTAAGIKPTAYQHNGKYIDIEVNSGTATTTFSQTADNNEINIGNLTVTKGGLDIDYKTTTGSGSSLKVYRRTLTVNGDMTVAAATTIKNSQKINVTGDLNVEGATLTYKGDKVNVDGLAVTGDINVNNSATFDADEVNAINITCANFYLTKSSTAKFGNRTGGSDKNLVVSGTISNPETCYFLIHEANQDTKGSVLAWVSCKKLEVGGKFSSARPRVE